MAAAPRTPSLSAVRRPAGIVPAAAATTILQLHGAQHSAFPGPLECQLFVEMSAIGSGPRLWWQSRSPVLGKYGSHASSSCSVNLRPMAVGCSAHGKASCSGGLLSRRRGAAAAAPKAGAAAACGPTKGLDASDSAAAAISAASAAPGNLERLMLEDGPVIVRDDLSQLLECLPEVLRLKLREHPRRSELLEVVLDLGRRPEARFLGDGGGEYLSQHEVTRVDLEAAQEAVGEFGGDNRAGVEGTLHRISGIRNRKGHIVGLTCRVGRAVTGHVDMIRVGKTTVIREIARVLSDELHRRVVIVDTSNEIGGDGDIPHPAIGGARRMQVPDPAMQHRIMVEAVENHMPEVVIVDEIGTEAEALACRTIAERGVMLVGTAHGQLLENLIKNPTLCDLVGGIQTVTLGDDEARARGTQKSVLERKAPPTFPLLIEMRERNYWVSHQTDRSVDTLLYGKRPYVEVRTRDGMCDVVIERRLYDSSGNGRSDSDYEYSLGSPLMSMVGALNPAGEIDRTYSWAAKLGHVPDKDAIAEAAMSFSVSGRRGSCEDYDEEFAGYGSSGGSGGKRGSKRGPRAYGDHVVCSLASGAPAMAPPQEQPAGAACRAAETPSRVGGASTYNVPMSMFAANRGKLVQRLASSGALPSGGAAGRIYVLLQGGVQLLRYCTDHEPTLPESYFAYLLGVTEPGFYGAIEAKTGESILFVPRLPASYAVWMGKIHDPQFYKLKYEVDAAFYVDEMSTVLSAGGNCADGSSSQRRETLLLLLQGLNSDSGNCSKPAAFEGIQDFRRDDEVLHPVLSECRVTKSKEELDLLRYVNRISSEAHVEVMRKASPGMMEYQLEADFQHYVCHKGGCRHCSYTCICATGENSAVLHYGHAGAPNDRRLEDGDMALLDMGAEYSCYASDITCSFPVNGRFSDDQRVVYEGVLAAQKAVFAAMKPGVSWVNMHILAERHILRALKNGGFLQGSEEEMLEKGLGAVFMPHGLGHFMGLDTHDVGGYPKGTVQIEKPGLRSLRTVRCLEEGMVLTVEPGCYFISAILEPSMANPSLMHFFTSALARLRGIGGVRLEDDVIVTSEGIENMTQCPREIADVEAVMAGAPWPPRKEQKHCNTTMIRGQRTENPPKGISVVASVTAAEWSTGSGLTDAGCNCRHKPGDSGSDFHATESNKAPQVLLSGASRIRPVCTSLTVSKKEAVPADLAGGVRPAWRLASDPPAGRKKAKALVSINPDRWRIQGLAVMRSLRASDLGRTASSTATTKEWLQDL
eukprot:SM000137S00458  [mRNA]  locus=s137:229545:242969:+ [translate_table: standard]